MKKETVLEFLRSECQMGNSIIVSTMGNGGAGLTILSGEIDDFLEELSDMDYVDGLAEPEDIEDFEDYNPHGYRIHRFDGENGYYVLVATYMDEVGTFIPNAKITEDEEYYFVDLMCGSGVGFYPKVDWTLEAAIEDQENLYSEN